MLESLTAVAAAALLSQTIDLAKPDIFQLINAKTAQVEHRGKKALKLTETTVDSGAGNTLAILKDPNFQDGSIELDIAGEPSSKASNTARGFVGVAFRVQPNAARYEYIYLRPTNGRADDQVRRNHSLQYSAHPDFPWSRLRKEEPEKYESYADLEPAAWTHVKIVVKGATARLYLGGNTQPNLIVNDLKLGATLSGKVALWIGPEAEGYFANLKITK